MNSPQVDLKNENGFFNTLLSVLKTKLSAILPLRAKRASYVRDLNVEVAVLACAASYSALGGCWDAFFGFFFQEEIAALVLLGVFAAGLLQVTKKCGVRHDFNER